MTKREALHQLVDELPEDQAELAPNTSANAACEFSSQRRSPTGPEFESPVLAAGASCSQCIAKPKKQSPLKRTHYDMKEHVRTAAIE